MRQREVLELLMSVEDPLVGSAAELALKCSRPDDLILHLGISDFLSKYGFQTKSIRLDGGEPRKRYSIESKELIEIYDCYFKVT